MTDLDKEKEKLLAMIAKYLKSDGICKLSTCDCACYGWNVLAHHAMCALARQGIAGCQISREYKFEVYDWTVVKDTVEEGPAELPAI